MPILEALHWVTDKAFRRAGFTWEVRRSGEASIGLWRLPLKRGRVPARPKRFVLVPGFGDTSLSWLGVLAVVQKPLREKFDEIVLLDFPGFRGFLASQKCAPSMDLLISAFEDTMDSLKPHTVFGHSLGGWLTGTYAADCGEGKRPLMKTPGYTGPDTIILASPSGVIPNPEDVHEFKDKFERAIQDDPTLLRKALFAKEPLWFKLIAPWFSNFLKREDIVTFVRSFKDEHRLDERISHVKAKVWILWGEQDELTRARWAEGWLKGLGDKTELVKFEELGHSLSLEGPIKVGKELKRILS